MASMSRLVKMSPPSLAETPFHHADSFGPNPSPSSTNSAVTLLSVTLSGDTEHMPPQSLGICQLVLSSLLQEMYFIHICIPNNFSKCLII